MRLRHCLAVGLTGLALVGASVVFGQRPAEEAPFAAPQPAVKTTLDPNVFAVRLLLGVGDDEPRSWSGRVSVDHGEVLGVEGGRFRKGDAVTGRDSWKARSLRIRTTAVTKQPAAKKKAAVATRAIGGGPGNVGPTAVPTAVIVSLKASADATLKVSSDQGEFTVPLAELATGATRSFLDDQVQAQRVAPTIPLADSPLQEDFPAAVSDMHSAWVAYIAHSPVGPEVLTAYNQRPRSFANLAPSGGGDMLRLAHLSGGNVVSTVDLTAGGLDLWRPAIAVDRGGKVVVVYVENRGGNFDLYRVRYDPATLQASPPERLTSDPGADTDPALARAPDGTLWLAWQAWRDGRARILLMKADGDEKPLVGGDGGGNEWSPALGADGRGNVWVAYDTYAAGNYDVHLRKFRPDGTPDGLPILVASTPKYETHPSLAVDGRGRVWVAYEERTANWGKDAENLITGQGSSLYRQAAVRVRCLDGERLVEAPDPLTRAPQGSGLRIANSFPRLATDAAGFVWLAFRHRQEAVWGNNATMVVGAGWVEYVTALTSQGWTPPQPLPNSDGLLDNRPALIAPEKGAGPLLIAYSSDGRLRREVEFSPELARTYATHFGTPPGVANNDIFVAAVAAPGGTAGTPDMKLVTGHEPAAAPVPAVHATEPADLARMRAHRVEAGGKIYRLFRGDFHRHTEISMDGGFDGSLEDMWRYAIDAADFDWMGNADHDNGSSKEYTWWLVQKTTDLFRSPRLTTLFTYERSNAYPHGHRNVMFDHRGVRTLPRLVEGGRVVDDDTKMLYDYLAEHGGICASHTSGTGMGTDWRDLNAAYEPMVEIFQGHRNSYEHFGAPRVARRPGESIGGWQPLGMVWNALAMQYRVGFQASSDHISTHISYAIAIAEEPTRASVLDAFRRRHCYGATDNIVLDVRTADGKYLMGDEFDKPADGPVRLKVLVHGTKPVARVDVIKDFVYVYSTQPDKDRVEFEWTDHETRGPGLSWYYVRALQADGQIAWGSPLWVRDFPKPAGQ